MGRITMRPYNTDRGYTIRGSVFNKVREGKTNRVLVESVLDWYGVRHAPNLARPITTLTHDVLLKLRDSAYRAHIS